MGNMSYCRFENTAGNLCDCEENMDVSGLSERETKARKLLIETCVHIAQDYGDEVGYEVEATLK